MTSHHNAGSLEGLAILVALLGFIWGMGTFKLNESCYANSALWQCYASIAVVWISIAVVPLSAISLALKERWSVIGFLSAASLLVGFYYLLYLSRN